MHSYMIAFVASLMLSAMSTAASTTPQEAVIPTDGKIRMKLNGVEQAVLAMPDGPGYPTMTTTEAARLGLKSDSLARW